jgi:hypothetical protein
MSDRLKDYLIGLGEDANFLRRHLTDPVAAMEKAGLTAVEIDAVKNGDARAIRDLLKGGGGQLHSIICVVWTPAASLRKARVAKPGRVYPKPR